MVAMRRLACLLVVTGWALPVYGDALPPSAAHALAPLAPQGRWVVRVEQRHSGYDHAYDNGGEKFPLGSKYDGLNINSTIFPALALLGSSASLGVTTLTSKADANRTELAVGYGVNENLTVGIITSYVTTRTTVNVSLSGGNTGWSAAFNPTTPISITNFPFAPIGGGALAPLDAAGLNQILTAPAFGYSYTPLAGAETTGFANVMAGLLWRSLKTAQNSLILGLAYREGLAEEDDPDNLFDFPVDDNSNDLLAQVEYFHHWGQFDLRGMAKHVTQLADHVTMRVPAEGELLSPASSKESLERNLGDFWEYEAEMGYRWSDWRLSTTLYRWQKEADSYHSNRGQNTALLESNTAIRSDQWRLALSWSGIGQWRQGGLPLPLVVKFEVQETYAGRNTVDVRDYYLVLTSFF